MLKTIAIIELNQLYAAKDWLALARHPFIYLKPEWAMELPIVGGRQDRSTI